MRTTLTIVASLICIMSLGQIPSLTFQDSKNKQKLEIAQLNVSVNVVGNMATTTFDVIYHNPLNRNLEGELSMALGDGQELCRYALDINGKLREGVIAEKVKARQTFEAVTRQNIDPGIVNLTKGNSFNTKIFPIPAQGNKRVILAIAETLKGDEQNLYYSLPMEASQNIGLFKLDVKVIKSQGEKKDIASEFENMKFDSNDNAYVLSFERKNYSSAAPLKFTIPRFSAGAHQLFTCNFEGQTYFYLNLKAPKLKQKTKETPHKIAVYWDHSLSASQRSIEKELKLLDSYLVSFKGAREVTLVAFNNKVDMPQTFRINQNADKITEAIRQLDNDGATCLDDLKFDSSFDEIILFSDAVNTIGEANIISSKIPVYTVSSGKGANYSLLKKIASASRGVFIDLNVLSVEKALKNMNQDNEMFISCTFDPSSIMEVYPNTPGSVNEYFELSGILKADHGDLTVNYGTQNKITQRQTIEIHQASQAPVARIWASKKIQSMMEDPENNQKEMMQLGQKFNIVTANTAFIVLDRVEDYVAHGIIPPDELKEEYNKMLANQFPIEALSPKVIQERNIDRLNQLKSWYTNPPKVSSVSKNTVNTFSIDEEDENDITSQEEISISVADVRGNDEENGMDIADLNARMSLDGESENSNVNINHTEPSIKVLAWLPDAPYMQEMRSAANKNLDSLYFILKEENKDRPSFYIEMADFFFEKKMKATAVRVLSNTLELDLENPELLKVAARRLLQEGEYESAIKVLQEIKKLRPEEPQSFRDLALAYQAAGNYQDALESYLFVMDHDWNRFEEIKDIVLNELNNLVCLHKDQLNLKNVNAGYLNPMPLDIRITLDWSSNENDIDLWVIDPNGEKCFYSHANTKIGGKITRDFTRGYGPEEFTLRNAKRGTYTVYVDYFGESRQTITGPVTIYANLTTHYGTSQQQTKAITVQLMETKETRQVGQLEFDN